MRRALAVVVGWAAAMAFGGTLHAQPAEPEADASATEPAVGAESDVRYLAPLQEELERLRLSPLCERLSAIRARCTFHHVTRDARYEIVANALYSDESDTIYLWVPGLVTALPDDPATPALLRRLMELNGSMLTTKLEWRPVDGEVRISAVLHTDSNFDRRALRNLVRVLLQQAERYRPELTRLMVEE